MLFRLKITGLKTDENDSSDHVMQVVLVADNAGHACETADGLLMQRGLIAWTIEEVRKLGEYLIEKEHQSWSIHAADCPTGRLDKTV